ncbi:MAG: glutathione S-transferase family protein [Pseudomonadales bacterium]|nr:glutathione S-transferase family protein [Pseudomonadales bacterium]
MAENRQANRSPLKVYGISVSYYTGKLEAYLRYKGIAYTMDSPYAHAREVREKAGALQVPLILREDGRWMSDSTPIILAFENEFPAPTILPHNPVVRFVAMLIEDYADEWLWRAAMHYRWSYEHDRALLSRILVDEVGRHVKVPRFLKLMRIARRQHRGFVLNDGVTAETRAHVEAGYRAALSGMTAMLAGRPYLFGGTPSIADFGLMGPMLRHFGQDPTPAEIMRNEAPAVWEWVARVWNAGAMAPAPAFVDSVPDEAALLLREIAETHLEQLARNAEAYARGASHFDMTVQGCRYTRLPVSRYRVHCLEQLRAAWAGLSADDASRVQLLLPYDQAGVLWQPEPPARSDYDTAGEAPYNKAINVYGDGVPH